MAEVQKKGELPESRSKQEIALEIMRKPFAANQISKMCRPLKRDSQPGKCLACGGWHKLPSMQISYVGHAALTDRLLDADPLWTWEPLALAESGKPLIDSDGGMWIKLTVAGVTRLGYGDAQGKTGADATKEIIGDALRNAAMRFGAALELWHKGELHVDEEEEKPSSKANGKDAAKAILAPASNSGEVPTYIKQAAATVNDWKLEGEVLKCYVYATDLLKDKNGGEYIAVRQNAKVNGQTKIFCRHQSLFTALGNAKNQHCTFYLGLGKYISIEDVMQVGEQKYRNGQPITIEPATQVDESLPF